MMRRSPSPSLAEKQSSAALQPSMMMTAGLSASLSLSQRHERQWEDIHKNSAEAFQRAQLADRALSNTIKASLDRQEDLVAFSEEVMRLPELVQLAVQMRNEIEGMQPIISSLEAKACAYEQTKWKSQQAIQSLTLWNEVEQLKATQKVELENMEKKWKKEKERLEAEQREAEKERERLKLSELRAKMAEEERKLREASELERQRLKEEERKRAEERRRVEEDERKKRAAAEAEEKAKRAAAEVEEKAKRAAAEAEERAKRALMEEEQRKKRALMEAEERRNREERYRQREAELLEQEAAKMEQRLLELRARQNELKSSSSASTTAPREIERSNSASPPKKVRFVAPNEEDVLNAAREQKERKERKDRKRAETIILPDSQFWPNDEEPSSNDDDYDKTLEEVKLSSTKEEKKELEDFLGEAEASSVPSAAPMEEGGVVAPAEHQEKIAHEAQAFAEEKKEEQTIEPVVPAPSVEQEPANVAVVPVDNTKKDPVVLAAPHSPVAAGHVAALRSKFQSEDVSSGNNSRRSLTPSMSSPKPSPVAALASLVEQMPEVVAQPVIIASAVPAVDEEEQQQLKVDDAVQPAGPSLVQVQIQPEEQEHDSSPIQASESEEKPAATSSNSNSKKGGGKNKKKK